MGATLRGFLEHLTLKSSRTQQEYGKILFAFSGECPNKISHIRPEHIERYLSGLNLSNKTKNLHLAAIRAFFNWVEVNYDISSPARKVGFLSCPPAEQRIVSHSEYHRLIKYNTGQIRDCIIFLANTGLRAAEFVNLSPESFSNDFVTVIGKGKKKRSIPLNPAVKEILPTLKLPKNKVALWRLCQKAAHNANVKPFGSHALRHYFATQLYNNGIELSKISRLLGHSSTVVTEKIYIHFSDNDLIGVTDVLR